MTVNKEGVHLRLFGGPDYLVYGAITERAGSLSLGIELSEAETGHIRWAKRYDAPDGDPLSWAAGACPMIVGRASAARFLARPPDAGRVPRRERRP